MLARLSRVLQPIQDRPVLSSALAATGVFLLQCLLLGDWIRHGPGLVSLDWATYAPFAPLYPLSLKPWASSAGAPAPALWANAGWLALLLADSALVHRAVTNLVGNALKFTPKEGRITIAASRDKAAVRVAVKDTGPGIPKEKLEKVFDKFFQVTETKGQARHVGTGLGLTITQEIVKAHGGKIWVESDLGRGATFYFTLPVGEAPAGSASGK